MKVISRAGSSRYYVAYDARVVKPGKLTPGTLVPIRTATNRPGRPIRLAIDGAMAVTPDGKTIYVGTGGTVTPIRIPAKVAVWLAGHHRALISGIGRC